MCKTSAYVVDEHRVNLWSLGRLYPTVLVTIATSCIKRLVIQRLVRIHTQICTQIFHNSTPVVFVFYPFSTPPTITTTLYI